MARARTARKAAGTAPRRAAEPRSERIPAWAVPAVYALTVVILFHEFFFFGGWLLGIDTYALSYFARHFYTTFIAQTGQFPVWQPLLFGGMPFVDGMHGDIFYPPSLALFFMDTRVFWGWKMVLHIFLAGTFFHLWLRALDVRRGPALFGGLMYMMGADLVSLVYPGGDGKLFVSALAPLTFLLTERAVRYRRLSDFALFGLGITLVVFTSHMQLAYFTVWGVSLYFFFRLWQVGREHGRGTAGRALALFAVAGVLGVGAAAVQFVPPLRYLQDWSHRADRTLDAAETDAYAYSTTYSLHPEEIVSLAVPEFVGQDIQTAAGPVNPYWGRNPFKINSEYAGLVPLLLIPLLFVGRRDPRTWFFTGMGVLALLYALGATTPFFRLFYLIPGVNLFRAPSLIIFLYALSLCTLAALALQRLLDAFGTPDGPRLTKTLWIAAGVMGILALLQSAGVITNLWLAVFDVSADRQAALQGNLGFIRAGFWIAALIAVAVAGAWHTHAAGFMGPTALIAALCIVGALDLYRADRPFIEGAVLIGDFTQRSQSTLFEPDESIRFLLERQAAGERFRAYDISPLVGAQGYGQNDVAAHGIEQLAGHHGNEIGRYRELIGGENAGNLIASEFRLLDLTNTQYVLSPGRLDPEQAPGLEEAFVGSRSIVYRRTGVLPREYLVGRFEIVSDDRAVSRLLAPDFDMRSAVVLPEPPSGIAIEPDPQGSIRRVDEGPDGYTLEVETDRPALVVISENYYPAWQATVDGESVPLLRANYTFRAVPVPAGTHTVEFTYRSETLGASAGASVVILLVLLGVGLSGVFRRREGQGTA